MNNGYMVLWVLTFLVLFTLDIGLIISLIKKGDERRQMIIWKSSTQTFCLLIGILFLNSLTNLVASVFNLSSRFMTSHDSSFSLLTITAIVYFFVLYYHKKKLGN